MVDETEQSSSSIWLDVGLVIGAVAILAGSFLYAPTQELFHLRKGLRSWSVWGLEVCLLLVVVGFAGTAKSAGTLLREAFPTRRQIVQVGALGLFALLMLLIVPRRNIIFWDEHIYMNIAQNITAMGRAELCTECNAEFGEVKVFQAEYNKQPNGYPFFLAIFYRFLGWSEGVAFFANSVAYLLGMIGVGLTAALLFRNRFIALASAFGYAATPIVINWTGTASAEVLSSASCALGALAVVLLSERPSIWRAVLAAGVTAWMIQVRSENLLMLAPLGLYVLTVHRWRILQTPFLVFVFLFALLSSIQFFHLYAVRYEDWGSPGQKFSFGQLWHNLPINGAFLFTNKRYPLVLTLLALAGLAGRGNWKERICLFLWFLWSWGIYLLFYAGSYDYGADVRFSVMFAPPAAILAARGAFLLGNVLRPAASGLRPLFLISLLAAASILQFLPLARTKGFEALDARLDADYTIELAKHVPPDALVLSHVPGLWLIRGFNAAQTYITQSQRSHVDNDLFVRYQGGVYFHYGYWCNVPDPPQNSICEFVLKNYDASLVAERSGRGHNYKLYKLSKRPVNADAK